MYFNASTDFDVIVIGGRPAGSSTAARLGKQGLRVLLLERAAFPSLPAVSSPIIYGSTMTMLDEIGAREEDYARDTPKIRRMVQAITPAMVMDIQLPDYKGRDYAYAVDRARFDAALWDAALRYPTVEGRQEFHVTDLLWESGPHSDPHGDRVCGIVGIDKDKQRHEITAGLVIGADGRFSLVARKANAAVRESHDDAPTTLYYAYWKGVAPYKKDGITTLSTAAGYGGTQPGIGYLLMDSADNTCAVVIEGKSDLLNPPEGDSEAFYLDMLQQQPMVWDRVKNGEMITSVRGMKRVGNLYREPGGKGWALVGDAYHQKDPLDGQGIYNAVFSGKALAAAVKMYRAGELATWQDALDWYDETFRIKTYGMYRALISRVEQSFYADQPPEWMLHTVARWTLEDPLMKDVLGRFITRQIPPDVVTLLTPGLTLGAVVRGGLKDLRRGLRERILPVR